MLAKAGVKATSSTTVPGSSRSESWRRSSNIACDIAQQRIASPSDIDLGVRIGLGYPEGPLSMGDRIGPRVILDILDRMHAFYRDPRYRPSPWLKRRALLGCSLSTPEY